MQITVEPLETDILWEEQKCSSYGGVRLIETIFNRNASLGHRIVRIYSVFLKTMTKYGSDFEL